MDSHNRLCQDGIELDTGSDHDFSGSIRWIVTIGYVEMGSSLNADISSNADILSNADI